VIRARAAGVAWVNGHRASFAFAVPNGNPRADEAIIAEGSKKSRFSILRKANRIVYACQGQRARPRGTAKHGGGRRQIEPA